MLPNTTAPNNATLYEDRDRYAGNRTASLYYNNASLIAGNTDKTDNFVEGLFIDKLSEQKEFINQLMYLVDQRQRLFKRNVGALESAISRTYNLFPSSQSGLRYEAPLADAWKNKLSLERVITDIESKKSAEYVRSWQDVVQLKKIILPAITEYMRTKRKLEMLVGKDSQDDIFNPYLREPAYHKVAKTYILSRRIP